MYVSKLDVAAGNTVTNGEQLAEIDGQPMFALTGAVPAWRDLTPGETGPDVAELQDALSSLGYYDDGDTPGYYGSATEYAVSLYYQHLGYTPPSSGGVPAADVVFLPSLPATVVAVNGATGEQPGQPFLELAARGSLALTGELPPAYAGQVKAGLKVTIYDEVTGIHATGTVADLGTATTVTPAGTVVDVGGGSGRRLRGVRRLRVFGFGQLRVRAPASRSSGSGSSGSTVFIPLAVHPSAPLPAALNGENVLVTVQTGQTEGPVLTVPAAAIVTTASGTSYVTVVGAHGKQTRGSGDAGHHRERLRPGDPGGGRRAGGGRPGGGERVMTRASDRAARAGPDLPRAAAGAGAAPGRPGDRRGRLRRGDRAVRLGQVDAAAPARPARLADPGQLPARRPGHRPR